ncbi:related to RNase III domain protein [Rhynchosporium secalis]|uniref:Related to RNase III domain protein n=1 Tax=Rhynchosporium secalis TaxID=38038 RepID=A0A1E1M265_RHYSE|nr:related to RNase III domain protein [Rhynchosporium secalis]
MASHSTRRSLQTFVRKSRPLCECANSRTSSIRQFSISRPRKDAEYETEGEQRPRWSYTPQRMKAPYPYRIKETKKVWECNTDPKRLDRFYIDFLGRGGDKVLTDEIKWLAITHKSFDQGRRGFNDRLAFYGRRILNLQTNIALVQSPTAQKTQSLADPSDDRLPFAHPALEGLRNLTDAPINEILTKDRLGPFAAQLGMSQVMRWTPRNIDNLESSGIDVVLTTSLYAIIGAIALQRGGNVAASVVNENVLKPLGIL